jgi:hypothetical protein
MNESLLVASEAPRLPERVFTDWRRFSSGLWRVPEGDIQAASSVDAFPKLKAFTHAAAVTRIAAGISPGRYVPFPAVIR